MKEGIKLIWDFRGPNAAPIAEHHVIHLKEFAEAEHISPYLCAIEKVTDMHCIAYMIVEEKHINDLRERLKPNRGQRYKAETT